MHKHPCLAATRRARKRFHKALQDEAGLRVVRARILALVIASHHEFVVFGAPCPSCRRMYSRYILPGTAWLAVLKNRQGKHFGEIYAMVRERAWHAGYRIPHL